MASDDDDFLAAMRLLSDDSPPASPRTSSVPAPPVRLPGATWAFLRDPAYARALDACVRARGLEGRIWDCMTPGSDAAAAAEYARACEVYPLQVEGYHRLALLLLRGAVSDSAVAAAAGLLRVAAKHAGRLRGIPPPWNADDICKAEVAAGKAAEQRLVLLLFSKAAEMDSKTGKATDEASAAEKEARKLLQQIGYEATLAPEILRSDCSLKSNEEVRRILTETPFTDREDPSSPIFFKLEDSVLPPSLLSSIQAGFAPTSPFWRVHNYGDSAPFFSYLYNFADIPKSSLEQSIRHLWRRACAINPAVSRATVAEWWVHSRPHSHGHQLHYDSDDEGRGGVRHPIQGSVFFVNGHISSHSTEAGASSSSSSSSSSSVMVGGATMIANQRLTHRTLASQAWLVPPKTNRYMMFDGRYLHGVMPGAGPAPLALTPGKGEMEAAAAAAAEAEAAAAEAVATFAPSTGPPAAAAAAAAAGAQSRGHRAAVHAATAAATAIAAAPGGFARRVTFMVAYWERIDARPRPLAMDGDPRLGTMEVGAVRGDEACPAGAGGARHGAAMVVDEAVDAEWLAALPVLPYTENGGYSASSEGNGGGIGGGGSEEGEWGGAREGVPAWVPRAWETCAGLPYPSTTATTTTTATAAAAGAMPAYEKCFQGL